MLVGTIAAILRGISFPFFWLFIGEFINVFTSQSVTAMVINTKNLTINNCSTVLDSGKTIADIIRENYTSRASCLLNDGFIAEINTITYMLIGIGLFASLVSYIQISFFQTAAERQIYKIRLKYYRAILRQDIAWFDDNPTGEVATRLSE